MTNILATITVIIVTNVTQVDNVGYAFPDLNQGIYPVFIYDGELGYRDTNPIKEPTEKIETTTIKEVTTLSFDWDGEPVKVKREKVLSTTVKRWSKKESWVEVE